MKNLFSTLVLCVLFVTGCVEFEEPVISEEGMEQQSLTRSAIVSDQNPYSLENVQEAYNDMRPSLGLPAKTITATHHYVRFFVQDSVDYAILSDSLNLELIEYPLDVELSAYEMAAYMSNTSNMWYYTAVSPGFVYPSDIEHEFLDYIYMQNEFPGTRAPGDDPQISDGYYDLVIEQAMQNIGIAIPPTTRATPDYPSATICYEDDYDRDGDGYPDNVIIPLEGVKIRCTNFINVGSGTTDANGTVTGIKGWGGKFRNAVGYHIIWDNPKWNIRDGRTGQAKTHGPKQKERWVDTIKTNEVKHSYFAAAHRALWAYFYETYLRRLTREGAFPVFYRNNMG